GRRGRAYYRGDHVAGLAPVLDRADGRPDRGGRRRPGGAGRRPRHPHRQRRSLRGAVRPPGSGLPLIVAGGSARVHGRADRKLGEEATALAGVTGRTYLFDLDQQRVPITVQRHRPHVLVVAGGLALHPVAAAAAGPVGGPAAGQRLVQRLLVHPREHEHLTGAVFLHHRGDQAVGVPAQPAGDRRVKAAGAPAAHRRVRSTSVTPAGPRLAQLAHTPHDGTPYQHLGYQHLHLEIPAPWTRCADG